MLTILTSSFYYVETNMNPHTQGDNAHSAAGTFCHVLAPSSRVSSVDSFDLALHVPVQNSGTYVCVYVCMHVYIYIYIYIYIVMRLTLATSFCMSF